MNKKTDKNVRQALILWGVFILLNILINGTIPFALGKDLRAWTASPTKDVLFNLIQYGLIFLATPLILTKGWKTVRQPAFLLPLILAIIAMTLRTFIRPAAAIAVFVLVWLHARHDLSELGFRSRDLRGDAFALILMTLLMSVQGLFGGASFPFNFPAAFQAGIDRLFFNPASTTETIFYFGFMTERLSLKFGRWWTPILIGLMYGFHEMTNPDYWYKGV
ncbi:MAG: hypothetical protein FJZ87_07650, partial [Chloroflexi bacterium]|nr:hypothetical protein [Chloroflexota bacterium]